MKGLPLSLTLVRIKDSEAADHIGEEAEIRGIVSEVCTNLGHTFIAFSRKFPNQLFTGFVQPGTELSADSAFLKSLKGKEISIIGMIELVLAVPACAVFTKDQIKVKWKDAKEDPFDYLSGVVNDRYRENLGLARPLNAMELRNFKAYLDQNVEHWEDKDSEYIWKLIPKFRRQ
jgi:hypothetical protein